MITPSQFDNAIESLERGVALKTAKATGFLSYTDVNTLAKEIRPYLEHMQRFMVMSLTFASAYLVLCTLSWGLLLGVHKRMEIKQEVPSRISAVTEISLLDSMNATDSRCIIEWGDVMSNGTLRLIPSSNILLKSPKSRLDSISVLDSMIIYHTCHLAVAQQEGVLCKPTSTITIV